MQQPKTNTMMLPSTNPNGILAASANVVQSRQSDRRESNGQQQMVVVSNFRQNHQRKPQLSIDYQTIFNGGSPNGSGAGLNITELYSHYTSAKAANGNQQQLGLSINNVIG